MLSAYQVKTWLDWVAVLPPLSLQQSLGFLLHAALQRMLQQQLWQ